MKSLMFIASLLMAATSFAQTNSQVIYLPNSGQSALEGTYIMGPNVSETKQTATGLGVSYLYGVDDSMVVGGQIANGSAKSDGTTVAEGMSDLYLTARMKSGGLIYGADLSLPLTKAEIKDGKMTLSSGGISISPTVVYLMNQGALNFGGQAAYKYNMEKTTNYVVEQKSTGGHVLSLMPFVEFNYGSGFLTAQFTYSSSAAEKDADGVETSEAYTTNTIELGGTYAFTDSITGIASYAQDKDSNSDNASTTMNVGARFTF